MPLSNYSYSLQNPPFASDESNAAYLDFLTGLDQINQQDFLDPHFTGSSASQVSPDLIDMFTGCYPEVNRLLEEGKVGETLHDRATWERQVRAYTND